MASSTGSHLASGNVGNNKRKTDSKKEKRIMIERLPSSELPENEIIASEKEIEANGNEEIIPVPSKRKHRHIAGKILLVILAFCIAFGVVGLGTVLLITHGPSEQAKMIFVRTFLDTGTMKWVPDLFMSHQEVDRLNNPVYVQGADKYSVEKEAAVTEVVIEPVPEDLPVIELVDISGPSWHGKMIVVRDPSLVRLAITETMEERGVYGFSELKQVEEFCEQYGAVAGITAGGFDMETGAPAWFIIKGGRVVVSCHNARGCAVGFTADHRLLVGWMNETEALERGMVEGLCWPPILIENGVKVTGMGGGYNPRAAIGQKADGTVILVLIEGRMVSNLGASFDDLADFMEEQGCINACNLDSGRSSIMVYNGEPVTKVAIGAGIQLVNRAAPNAFVVMPEGWTDD